MRMFAGPNGSGKSVLKSYLPESLLGVYLNPDEIEANITKRGCVDLQSFGIQTTEEEVLSGECKDLSVKVRTRHWTAALATDGA